MQEAEFEEGLQAAASREKEAARQSGRQVRQDLSHESKAASAKLKTANKLVQAANKIAKGVEHKVQIAFRSGAQVMQARMLGSVDRMASKREKKLRKREAQVAKDKAKNEVHRAETMHRKRKVEERDADLNHFDEMVLEAGENNQELRLTRGVARAANAGKRKAEEAMVVLTKDHKEVGHIVEMLKEKSKVKTGNVSEALLFYY